MVTGTVVFHRGEGYDFYVVRSNLKDEYDIDRIEMPLSHSQHRDLTDELVIGIPSSERCGGELDRRLIAAYEALRGRK